MSFDERTPRDIFDRDAGGRRRPSQIDNADDLEVRFVAPASPVADKTADAGRKKLLQAGVIAAALIVSVLLLTPSRKPSAGTTSPVLGNTSGHGGTAAPPVVVIATTTTQKVVSTSDPQFDDELGVYLKQFQSKTPALTALAAAVRERFAVPVVVDKTPPKSAQGSIEISEIGSTEILVEVRDASSRVVGFHTLTVH